MAENKIGVRYPKENARCRDRPKSELDDPKAILIVFLQDFEYWLGLKTFFATDSMQVVAYLIQKKRE